jgi:hypothetical protein
VSIRLRAFAIDALLQALAPRLPERLVPRDALHAALSFAAPLPPCWDWVMLETRLGHEGGPVDLLASVTEPGAGRARLRDALHTAAPAAEARLANVLPLLRAWAAGTPPLDASAVVFLEWDAPSAPLQEAGRGPLAFLSFDRHFWRADSAAAGPRTLVDLLPWALAPQAEAPPWTPWCDALRALLRTLPEHALTLSVASTTSRGQEAARVLVRMAPRQVLQWLGIVGWPGELDRVRHWLQALYRPWDAAFLQFELLRHGDRFVIGPCLGLEPAQTTAAYGERADRARWLAAAGAAGIVEPERARAVLDWPQQWVAEVGAARALVRTSFHLKLVLRDGEETAKAYLGACVPDTPFRNSHSP